MEMLLLLLLGVCGIGSVVCYVMVIIKMFSNDESTMGIVCLVTLLCGVGGLIAFVYGWMKSGTWGIQNLMLAWTGCFVVNILVWVAMIAMGVGQMEIEVN